MCMNLGLLANIGDVFDKEVPTLVLANDISPIFAVVFSVIIIIGIYTTAVPMLWGVARQFAEEKTMKFYVVSLILTVVGFILGMTDFKVLVGTIYPFSGYVGLVLFIAVIYHEYIAKENREKIGAELNAKYQKEA